MGKPTCLGRLTAALLLSSSVAATSCALFAPSEEQVQAEFADYVAGANHCTDASECAYASIECPLGCFAVVRADRKDDVEAKARELVSEYESGGASCAYSCPAPGDIVCNDGRCGDSSQD